MPWRSTSARKVCKTLRFQDTADNQTIGYFMHYDEGRKVIYCSIPKVRRGRKAGNVSGKVDSSVQNVGVLKVDITINDNY